MSSLIQTPNQSMTYVVRGCQKQGNGYDCGVFAIAFATSLANREDPSSLLNDTTLLRDHLRTCIDSGKLTPIPSNIIHPRTREEKIRREKVFCYCRRTKYKPDYVTSDWVGCDAKGKNCALWVHQKFEDSFYLVKIKD
jgi:polycystin 1L2